MQQTLQKLILASLLLTATTAVQAANGSFGGGTGTSGSPFIIEDAADLDAVRSNLSAYYRLANNIDLTDYLSSGGAGYSKWGSSGWLPIGDASTPFQGNFDGNGKTIEGLWINRPSLRGVGLFGVASGSFQFSNLNVKIDGDVIGLQRVGGFVGEILWLASPTRTIINCNVTGGTVTGSGNCVGGFVGECNGRNEITDCYTTCNVVGSAAVGGFSGQSPNYNTYLRCYATGNVTSTGISSGYNYAGGFVGLTQYDTYLECYAMGNVQNTVAGKSIGGFAGTANTNSTIMNCFASGDVAAVAGSSNLGGFVGTPVYNTLIENCYASGKILTPTLSETGGFAGRISTADCRILNCYYDNQVNPAPLPGVGTVVGSPVYTVLGKTTAELQDPATYTGWDLTKWHVSSGSFPYFAWSFSITYNLNGGTQQGGTWNSYTYGTAFSLPTAPTQTGYTFAGWYRNAGLTSGPVTAITTTDSGHKEFWAKWIPVTYSITYNLDGGTLPAGSWGSYAFGTGLTLPIPTKTGFTFADWYDNSAFSGTAVTAITTTDAGAKTFYALWTATPPTITTTSLPGGTYGVAYSQTLSITSSTAVTWSIASGSLPSGLSLNSTTGVISGTPSAAGTSSFTIKATNSGGNGTQALSITINKADQTAPSPPVLANKTATSIEVTNSGTTYEYAINTVSSAPTGGWKSGGTSATVGFTALTSVTPYYLFARLAEDANHNASPASTPLTVTTDKATLSGSVTFSGAAKYGQALTVVTTTLTSTPDISGTTGLGTLSYQWMRDGAAISGSVSATYTVTAADIGRALTVRVSAANCSGSVTGTAGTASKASAPVGVNQTCYVYVNTSTNVPFILTTLLPDVSPLVLGSVTYTPVITTNTDGVLGTLSYTSGTTLTLPVRSVTAAGKTAKVTVTVRSANFEDFTAIITVETQAKTNVSSNIAFSDGGATYTGLEQTHQTATISGITAGTSPAWTYTYTAGSGTLGTGGKPLTAGTYTVTAKYEDSNNAGIKTVTFTISKATQAAPSAPVLANKTATSIEVTNGGATYEYAINTTNSAPASGWKSGGTSATVGFTALTPATTYYLFARLVENANRYVSAASSSLSVTLDTMSPVPVFDGLGNTYTVGASVSLKVKGLMSDKLTVFKVNGTTVSPPVFKPTKTGTYLIEATSTDGKLKIWKYVKVQ